MLAKEVLHTRKAVSRMYTNKAQLTAVNAQLTEQLAMVKVAGTLSKSTEVMTLVNNLVKVRPAVVPTPSPRIGACRHLASWSSPARRPAPLVALCAGLTLSALQVPQLSQQMQQMSKEMMKAGIIDEIMEDAMDSALDSEDMEDETELEVDKARHTPPWPAARSRGQTAAGGPATAVLP